MTAGSHHSGHSGAPAARTGDTEAKVVLACSDPEPGRLLGRALGGVAALVVVQDGAALQALLAASPAGPRTAMVVLVDAALPGAAALLRSLAGQPGRPPVLLVVRAGDPPPSALLAEGADDALALPCDGAWLVQRLRLWLRAAAPEAHAGQPSPLVAPVERVALQSSAQHFALVDSGLRVVGSGGRAATALGVYRHPLSAREPILEALLPAHLPLVEPLLRRALRGERSRVELAVQVPDEPPGSTRPSDDAGPTGSGGAGAASSAPARWRDLAVEPARDAAGAIVGATVWIADDDARVQALLTLAKNEARFRALVQHSTDITSVFAADGTLVYASPTCERITGRPVGALIGRPLYDLIHPDDLVALADHLARKDPAPIATRVRHVVGTWVNLESVLSHLLDDPNVRGVVVNSRDISERVRAEAAIREREASLSATLRSIGEAVIATDHEGGVVRMNPVAERLTGWTLAEARGRPLVEVARLLPPAPAPDGSLDSPEAPAAAGASLPLVPSLAERALARGAIVNAGPQILAARDGSERPVAATAAPIRDGQDRLAGAVLVLRDIADEQRAAEALRRSERSFRALIERSPESIFVQRRGHLVYANPATLSLLGYRPEQIEGLPALELVHPDEREAARAREQQVHDSDRPTPAREERLLRSDGTLVVVDSIALRLDFDGAPAIVHIARDISGRKQMEQRLLVADRMVTAGTLAAGVAHEINNPLAAVVANLRYALDELERLQPDLPAGRLDDISDALRDAQEGGERVRVIVRDLKAFSRGDEERRGPIAVVPVLEATCNLASNEIRHRARLIKQFDPVPLVLGNEARLGQMTLNLLLNAAQAIVEGAADSNHIRLACSTDAEGRAVIEVSDSGAGIAPEHLKRLFDPFFTTKPVGLGTGLGLFVCQGIVTSMGGEISVQSEADRGTTFRVVLPPSPVQRAPSPAASPSPSNRRGRILVIDDEPMILVSLKRLLASDHELVGVTSAREALTRLTSGERFDLILCDLMMPEMTGMDLHARLLDLNPEQAQHMVFLTGGAFTPRAREFLDRVDNHRLEKPFDAAGLRALVRQWMR